MAFYGVVLKGDKSVPYVPPPDEYNLHLSQACLAPTVKDGKRVSVVISHQDEEPVIIATLTAGRADTVPLDLFLDRYCELSLKGASDAEVHVSGYFSPPVEAGAPPGLEDEDEDEDEDYEGTPEELMAMYGHQDDSDEDEEDEDEDEDDEDEDDEDEEDDRRKPHVVIEEIDTDEETKKAKGKAASQSKAIIPVTHSKVQQPESEEDEEEEGEEEDEDEEMTGEEEEGEEEDEDEEEEEEPAPAPKGKQAAAAAAAKRPAEEAKGKAAQKEQPPAKKQATEDKKQQQQQEQQKAKQQQEAKAAKRNVRRFENGFEIEELAQGPPAGKLAKAGKRVAMKYVGRLKSNGKVFDQTKGNKTFTFRLGVGEVIKGWDLGVEGMRVGDKRRLVIPPQLGYGSSGVRGTIPPNATLEFDVELVNVM